MRSILLWFWSGIKKIIVKLANLFYWLWDIFCSWVNWIVVSFVFVWDQIIQWVNDGLREALAQLVPLIESNLGVEGISAGFSSPIASYYLNLFSITDAIALLVELFAFFVLVKTCRLLAIPIRVLLDLL